MPAAGAGDVAIITLPHRPPWGCLVTTLWILAAFMGAVSIGVAASPGGVAPAPILAATVPLALLGAVPASVLTLLRARHRLRRRGARRLLLHQPHALTPAPDDAVASAIAAAAGCIDDDARRLRRRTFNTWEARLGRRLPRLWVTPDALPLLDTTEPPDPGLPADTGDDENEPADDPFRCKASTLGPLGDLASMLALSATGLVVIAAVGTMTQNWNGIIAFLATKVLLLLGLAIPVGLWLWLRGRRGYFLHLDAPTPRLVRHRRDGREADSWPLPVNDTLIIITSAGRRPDAPGQPLGSLVWRFVPPAGVPAFEVTDPNPAVTPWNDSLQSAVSTVPLPGPA